MTNSLKIYDRVQDPWQFCQSFGTEMAKSRLFGCDNASQGIVLAMAALAENENPISLARRFNVIDGNLAMKADAMLASFRQMGGRHKIISCTSELASVELTIGDETHSESLSWEEAQQEPFPYGRDGQLKKNWKTPRARKQMLWARVISEAVRRLRPEINSGTYTPEEAQDFIPDGQVVGVESAPAEKPTAAELMRQQSQQATAAKSATPATPPESKPGTIGSLDDDDQVVDAEFEVKSDSLSPESPCTNGQRQMIKEAFTSLGMTAEQQTKAIQKRGGQVLRNLTLAAADDLLQALTNALGDRTLGTSKQPPEHEAVARSMHESAPCPQDLIDQVKQHLADKSDPEFMSRLKKHLAIYGKAKLADLTYGDAQRLLVRLEQDQADEWFSHPLAVVEVADDQGKE